MTFDDELIKDFISAVNKAAKRETERNTLIAAAEAVIEAAERHGSVGYADRQMVNLQATVERMKE